jgi:D-alanyl-lipoteichoic acid acyltransferase DltB (MBOAT superfamily)
MLFNSGVFLQFFAAFLLLYWLARNNLKARNLLIVAASYLFYGWWTPPGAIAPFSDGLGGFVLSLLWQCRFLALLGATSVLDFSVGLGLDRLQSPAARKLLISLSIAVNLGILGFFKYSDFFVESAGATLGRLGISASSHTLGIILPVGISFYTFQSMSYALDVYRRQIPATRSLVNFLAFVSFFPQLVAGPIERASHLLSQFERTRVITRPMLEAGLWLIIWGMFKKVVVADNFAPLVEMVYQGANFSAPTVILGTVAFALQIYCDFSGYSDIARGTARVLGFDIMVNFNIPYAARNIREFWRRWHISLSTWLRDYLYISLGGNRRGAARTYVNLLLTMLLGGLWHGAAWSFALWGIWHGAGLAVHRILSSRSQVAGKLPPSELAAPPSRVTHRYASRLTRAASWLATLLFVLYGWLLFRARSFSQIADMTCALGNFSAPAWTGSFLLNLLVFSTPLVLMEFWQEKAGDPLAPLKLRPWLKAALQGALLVAIVLFWQREKVPFIYFQF